MTVMKKIGTPQLSVMKKQPTGVIKMLRVLAKEMIADGKILSEVKL